MLLASQHLPRPCWRGTWKTYSLINVVLYSTSQPPYCTVHAHTYTHSEVIFPDFFFFFSALVLMFHIFCFEHLILCRLCRSVFISSRGSQAHPSALDGWAAGRCHQIALVELSFLPTFLHRLSLCGQGGFQCLVCLFSGFLPQLALILISFSEMLSCFQCAAFIFTLSFYVGGLHSRFLSKYLRTKSSSSQIWRILLLLCVLCSVLPS